MQLLLDSSKEAVDLLTSVNLESSTEKMLFARALSRRANACFKLGCILEDGSAAETASFDEADICIARAVDMFRGKHVQAVGEAILVGGVTTLCRAHSFAAQDMKEQHQKSALSALLQFYRAEAVLRLAVGSVNEKSIFTHGNLSELLLRDFHQPLLSFLHLRRCCIVAVQVFGHTHSNAAKKISEFAAYCAQLGWHDSVGLLNDGKPEEIDPAYIVEDFARRGFPLALGESPTRFDRAIIEALNVELQDEDSAASSPEFWKTLWRDLGMPLTLLRYSGWPF